MSQQLVCSTPGELSKFLNANGKGAIAAALPKHLTPERMLRLVLTAFSTTPKLRECTAQSILASVVLASQIGLEIGVGGQGYLIPYKGVCTFVPGWKGLVGLLNNTGRATAWTGAVFEGDQWEFQLGSQPRCVHIPGENYGDPEKLIWVYACGQVNGSQMPVIEAWPMSRVIKHRNKFNKVGNAHYSFGNMEMYARKVVLLQVLKYMPQSVELTNALTAADASEAGTFARVEDGVVIDTGSSEIPTGNVGASGETIMENAQSGQGAPAKSKPAETANEGTGPTAEELFTEMMDRAGKSDIGKAALKGKLIGLKMMGANEGLDQIDAKRLASILEGWEAVVEYKPGK